MASVNQNRSLEPDVDDAALGDFHSTGASWRNTAGRGRIDVPSRLDIEGSCRWCRLDSAWRRWSDRTGWGHFNMARRRRFEMTWRSGFDVSGRGDGV